MSEVWSCGVHHDSDPPFAELVRAARCPGYKRPCNRRTVVLFVSFDDGDGTHDIPPLTFTASCAKHRPQVGRMVDKLAVGWLGVGTVLPVDVELLLGWFHGPSGLCAGDRGLAILTPRAAVPPSTI